MKIKILLFLLSAGLVVLAAWIVAVSNPDSSAQQPGAEAKGSDVDPIPEKYRETVRKGLEYLVKNQAKDGHWEGDDGKHPVAMTGLAGLALLMERTHAPGSDSPFDDKRIKKAKYSANIRKAADWLMEKSNAKREGLIFSEHASETSRYMQGHGLATLFLAGALREEDNDARKKKLTEVLTRAVKYIGKAQSTQGGWYDTSKVEGHDFDSIAATAIQIQALQAAENAGIPIPGNALNDGKEYLKKAMGKYEDKAKPGPKGNRQADTAAALVCCYGQGLRRTGEDDNRREKWLKYCYAEIQVGSDIKFGRDEIVHYYYAQALFNVDKGNWNGYRTLVFDQLRSKQNKDGSWPAADGIGAGPVYATALWCVVLQLDKGSHPTRPTELVKGP